MTYDLVIRGGNVVDGTGLPGYIADVAVKDGRIAAIGRVEGEAKRVVDADGLVVAPGFIDVHTHYDVQLDWDPVASPAMQHGVTTVLTGNCGFTLYPAKPADVDWLTGMLTRVEGMSREAMREGFRFVGGGFADYWRRLEGKLALNVGGYVGHSAVRRYAMSDAASERAATSAEIAQMKELVRAAMREGAVGFSTSQLDIHVGADGRGVPSNFASSDEITELCSVLAEFPYGAIEIIPRTHAQGHNDADRALLYAIAAASGKPIEIGPLGPTPDAPMAWQRTLEFTREARTQGVRIHPQFTSQRLGLHLRLADTFIFDEMPSWLAALQGSIAERCRKLADPAVREKLRHELATVERAAPFPIAILEVEHVRDEKNRAWIGRSAAELAAERGGDTLDAFLDASIAEDLATGWRTRPSPAAQEFITNVVRASVLDPLVMAGSSDGGAHLASFTGADYTTLLLTDWVPDPISLEHAIWRLAGMPAAVHGLVDRGVIRTGAKADLVLIDLPNLAAGEHTVVRDFPAGTERYYVDAHGYEMVIVNGVPAMERGKHTGALPGEVLRGA
ncbi:MAG: aminoacylase [Deltaproteobacteria bacterium]|nr:MAG: aminoacylase [Deltaproteobacteria bacterium]